MVIRAVRRLIWVPIIHAQADLGSAGESLKALYGRQFGQAEWERHARSVKELWGSIRVRIDRLGLDCSRLRLYQDGLPNCGRESEIVADLAHSGSPNHELLTELMQRGAILVGTESPELLLAEYKLVAKTLKSLESKQADDPAESQNRLRHDLLRERDAYIARRIDETLQASETGMIFLGLLHSLREHLASDVDLVTLDQVSGAADGQAARV